MEDFADMLTRALAAFFEPEPVYYHAGGTGFALFGPEHLACVAACAVTAALLVRRYRHANARARVRQERWMAGVAVGLLASKDVSYVALGLFEPLFWPLHICNLCEFVALAYAVAPQSRLGRRMADLLFCWGLTGGPGALLFPGWSYYTPALTYASLCGFAEHTLICACALCPLAGGSYAPRPRRVWFPLAVSVGCGLFFLWVNPLLGTNFFFVTTPEYAGAPFLMLVTTFGRPWWLAAYLAAAAGIWAASYAIWRLATRGGAAAA